MPNIREIASMQWPLKINYGGKRQELEDQNLNQWMLPQQADVYQIFVRQFMPVRSVKKPTLTPHRFVAPVTAFPTRNVLPHASAQWYNRQPQDPPYAGRVILPTQDSDSGGVYLPPQDDSADTTSEYATPGLSGFAGRVFGLLNPGTRYDAERCNTCVKAKCDAWADCCTAGDCQSTECAAACKKRSPGTRRYGFAGNNWICDKSGCTLKDEPAPAWACRENGQCGWKDVLLGSDSGTSDFLSKNAPYLALAGLAALFFLTSGGR